MRAEPAKTQLRMYARLNILVKSYTVSIKIIFGSNIFWLLHMYESRFDIEHMEF